MLAFGHTALASKMASTLNLTVDNRCMVFPLKAFALHVQGSS